MKILRRLMQYGAVVCALVGASEGLENEYLFERQAASYAVKSDQLREAMQSRNAKICCGVGIIAVVAVGAMSVAPFLAGFSQDSQSVALASAIWNSLGCLAASAWDSKGRHGPSSLLVAATICSWMYWQNWHDFNVQNHGLWVANVVLTSLAPAVTLVALCCFGGMFVSSNSGD